MRKGMGKGRPVLPQVLCGLALCFTMLIFAPVEMVQINSVNFWFGVEDFLPLFVVLFFAAFAVLELVYALLRKLPYSLWLLSLSLLFGGLVCVYVQGTYLCMGSEVLDSGTPFWQGMFKEMMLNAAVWAAILLGILALSLTKPKLFLKAVSAVSALILVMEGTALVTLALDGGYNSDINHVYCSDEEQFTFSDNGDVIMIMLDTFDARLMDRAIEENPEYANVFEDFTYYRNTSSSTIRTKSSFSSFMTGVVPDNSEPFFAYCRRAFKESRFLPAFKEAGMAVQVYTAPNGVLSVDQMPYVDNLRIRESHISDKKAFVKEMLYMIGYRYMPTMLQPFTLREYINDFDLMQEMGENGAPESTDVNTEFLNKLREDGVTVDADRRFFKFFLLHGMHKNTQMNRYLEPTAPDNYAEQDDHYEAALGCFAMLKELFAELEEKDIYDKATVIVFGDHGIKDPEDWLCSTVMLVKYPGETGPMRISMAPTELLDLRATALYGAGINYEGNGTPVHLWEGTEHRDRRILTHWRIGANSYEDYLPWLYEYAVPDDATDLDGYVSTGRVFKKE